MLKTFVFIIGQIGSAIIGGVFGFLISKTINPTKPTVEFKISKMSKNEIIGNIFVILLCFGVIFGSLHRIYKDKLKYNNKVALLEEKLKERELALDSTNCQLDTISSSLKDLVGYVEQLPIEAPLDTLIVRSNYGIRMHPVDSVYALHKGVDFVPLNNDTIYCAANGIVCDYYWDDGYGKVLIVDHNFGYQTRYAHLDTCFVDDADDILNGQAIGIVGSSGKSTGKHLHYEIIKDGVAIDPLILIHD